MRLGTSGSRVPRPAQTGRHRARAGAPASGAARVGHALAPAAPLLLAVVLAVGVSGPAAAGEIRLRDSVTTGAAVVRLSDIAEVRGLDAPTADRLSGLIIAPGPTRSHPRALAASQVRQTLEQRGVDLRDYPLSGATRVVVYFSPPPAATPTDAAESDRRPGPAPPGRRSARRGHTEQFEQRLAELVAQQLQQLAGDPRPWKVAVQLTAQPSDDVLQSPADVRVDPPRQATAGTHQLVAWVSHGAVSTRIPFTARAWQVVPVVVAVRAVERGERLQAQDVALRYVEQVADTDRALRRLEDAIGREVRQPLTADQPLTPRHLQQPLLVRKRDPVDVWVRCGSVRAHRRAAALSDGALGDTIPVEIADGSKTQLLARVTDIRTVEVLPNATQTATQRD